MDWTFESKRDILDLFERRGVMQNLEGNSRETHKRCTKCGEVKSYQDFYANSARSDGLSIYCRPCHISTINSARSRRRVEAIEILGGSCARCGYAADIRALQIDHVNSNGREERVGKPYDDMCRRIISGQPDGYQVLCANCNCIKRHEAGEFRAPSTYAPRKEPGKRTFKGWSERQPPSEDHKQAIADGLKRAYAEGRRKRGHSEETKRKISETKRRKRQG